MDVTLLQLEECVTSLKAAQFSKLEDMMELTTKAKELQVRSLSVRDSPISLFRLCDHEESML